ncbi:hypothetical protein FF1_017681 [Malus domestica]
MQEAGTKPIESAIVIVLTTSAHISVRSHKDCGYTAMLKGTPNKDVGVLNGMIAGVAMIGDGRKSLELLNKMVRDRVQPTETTFCRRSFGLHACKDG